MFKQLTRRAFALVLTLVIVLTLNLSAFADTVVTFPSNPIKDGTLTIGSLSVGEVVSFVDEGHGYGYYLTKSGQLFEITNSLSPELVLTDAIGLTYSYPLVYALTKSGEVFSYSNGAKSRFLSCRTRELLR
ncbi:MAG: hypothetical protein LBM98_13720 [Oscillospiraceae bacterium]|jgi:hypothetical protein|nr:hypothetical protein [Oscillospiraceae bacterium]